MVDGRPFASSSRKVVTMEAEQPAAISNLSVQGMSTLRTSDSNGVPRAGSFSPQEMPRTETETEIKTEIETKTETETQSPETESRETCVVVTHSVSVSVTRYCHPNGPFTVTRNWAHTSKSPRKEKAFTWEILRLHDRD
jgi:hypothetical protein